MVDLKPTVMKANIYIISIGIFLLSSCRSAEKLYNKGNYDEAVELAAKKLAKKPGDPELIQIVQDAYRYAVSDHESRIRNYMNSNSHLRFEQVLSQYNSLQRLYEAIRKSPTAWEIVQPADYTSYIQTYRDEAAMMRETRGDEMMMENNKQSFRNAYYEYQKALSLKTGDQVLRSKMEDALWNATTRVSIQPLSRFGTQYNQYGYDYTQFNNDLLRYVNNNRRGQFLDFYGMHQPGAQADFAVELRFTVVNIGRYRDQRQTREVSKQIVVKEIVHSKDSVTREYATVKARITTTTRTVQANGILQTTARETGSNRRVWGDTYRSEYNWVVSFSTYTGDERALSDADKKLLQNREKFPPGEDEILSILLQELRAKSECGISDYFNRYG